MAITEERTELLNFVAGEWKRSSAGDYQDVINPATGKAIASVPLSPASEVEEIANIAHQAYLEWRDVPVVDRIKPLFRLRDLLEENIDDLARTITMEAGKTFAESVGEMRRGIENVEVACGMPILQQGYNNEDIARGIDEHMFRQPIGVAAAIVPFNFPGMIPLWFLPYAVATGCTFILKPSERVPLTMQKFYGLLEKAGFPPGVVNLVNGGKETVDAILDHPLIRGVSFVGSTPIARYVYSRAAANGKRAQAQGGAKNPAVIMPDADMDMSTRILADSAFGCAGQRCLATSIAITVGDARNEFTERIIADAQSRKVGYGLEDDVQMGPVISQQSRDRIQNLVRQGRDEGARVLVGGDNLDVEGFSDGFFYHPTVLDDVQRGSTLADTEVFGPVLSLMHASNVDEAIEMVNDRAFGNQACIFTSSGANARAFRHSVRAGNIGVNLGVAAPMAFFPFSGWGDSFFGDLHAQGRHGVEFYTETKVVVERWPKSWARQF